MKNLILALLLFMVGCSSTDLTNAYIKPDGPCGYVVMLHHIGLDGDVELSRCLPLEDAGKLAAQINKEMAGKWSGGEWPVR
jgi:hypothetical protein